MAFSPETAAFINSKLRNIEPQSSDLPPFNLATDAQLVNVLDKYYSGELSIEDIRKTWHVGDERMFNMLLGLTPSSYTNIQDTYESAVYKFKIIGFEHDALTTPIGDRTAACITLECSCCLGNTGVYSSGKPSKEFYGWYNCNRRPWFNDYIYNSLNIMAPYIKSVTKESRQFYQASTKTIATTEDKVFMLSEYEVYGKFNTHAGRSCDVKEGTQYELYREDSDAITDSNKFIGGAAVERWLRSPNQYTTDHMVFCTVGTSTAAHGIMNYTSKGGICPAFCL